MAPSPTAGSADSVRELEPAVIVDSVSKSFSLQKDRAHSLKELITRRDRRAGTDRFMALDDVSLTIPKGSMYALVGHNGSGKSTLLRCIAKIYRPTSGEVTSNGRISTLLELGAGFHPDLTGRENVYLNATILGMSREQIEEVYDDIVEFAGIGDFIDSPVKIYSSGMYVRLGFAVAVHVQPEILIIDEVIAVGDAEFQRRCYEYLYDLRRKGVTIIVVTHSMDTVQTMCDGAAWLEHGVLQMVGTGSEVAAAYLRRVNEAEEAERAAAAGSVVVEADETKVAEGVEGGVRITGVDFLDGTGSPDGAARFGEPLTLRISYEAFDEVEEPVFGIAVHSIAETHVTGTNTKIADVPTGRIHGTGHVDYVMDRLPLVPGAYQLTVAVSDRYIQHNFDRRDHGWRFVVRSDRAMVPEGVVDLGGRWTVEDGT